MVSSYLWREGGFKSSLESRWFEITFQDKAFLSHLRRQDNIDKIGLKPALNVTNSR